MNKQRYSFDIRAGTTNEDEPVTQIDKTIIAYNLDDVIDWCRIEYTFDGLEEITSDELSIYYEKSYLAQVSDHGNLHEVTMETESEVLDSEGYVKEEYQGEYGNFRDVLDIQGSEITQQDYEYMTSGQYHNNIVDLTEKEQGEIN